MKEEPVLFNGKRITSESIAGDLNLFLPKPFFFTFLTRLFVRDGNLSYFSEVEVLVPWSVDCCGVNFSVSIQRT